ncbi:MAG TPA: hypothetical protein VE890_00675 [Thermoguttaceae bacterium]|nr:hypothetical protein [Thermoguttaceae bacterium]
MIRLQSRTHFDGRKVHQKAKQANITNLGHAGAALRLIARRSIRQRKGPAPAGSPPHTHTRRLPRAILYAVDRQRSLVVIGPAKHLAGTSGRAHEHGGQYRGERYERRPFMGPALVKIKNRLPKLWAGSVKT